MSEIMTTPTSNPTVVHVPVAETVAEARVEREVLPEVEENNEVVETQARHNAQTAQNLVMFLSETKSIRGTFEEIRANGFKNINKEDQVDQPEEKEHVTEGILYEAPRSEKSEYSDDSENSEAQEDSELAAKLAEEEEQAQALDEMEKVVQPDDREKDLAQQVQELQAQVAAGRTELELMKAKMGSLNDEKNELSARVDELSQIEIEMMKALMEFLAEKDAHKKEDLSTKLIKALSRAIAILINDMLNEKNELPAQQHEPETPEVDAGAAITSMAEFLAKQRERREKVAQQEAAPLEEETVVDSHPTPEPAAKAMAA
jgi:hypothetical protein